MFEKKKKIPEILSSKMHLNPPKNFPNLPNKFPSLPEKFPSLPENFPNLPEKFLNLPEYLLKLPENLPGNFLGKKAQDFQLSIENPFDLFENLTKKLPFSSVRPLKNRFFNWKNGVAKGAKDIKRGVQLSFDEKKEENAEKTERFNSNLVKNVKELKREGDETGKEIFEATNNVKEEFKRGRGKEILGVLGEVAKEEGEDIYDATKKFGERTEKKGQKTAELANKKLEIVDRNIEEVGEIGKEVAQEFRIPVGPIRIKGVKEISSLQVKQILCGILAGGISGAICSPFDILQARVLGNKGGTSVKEVIFTALKKEGSKTNLTKIDFRIGISKTAINKAVQFYVYEWMRERHVASFAGAVAGVASTIAVYPYDVVLDRVTLQKDVYKGFLSGIRTVLAKEGVPGLYRGIVPAIIAIAPNSSIGFYSYHKMKDLWKERTGRKEIGNFPITVISVASGALSTILTYPLEATRKKISLGYLDPKTAIIYTRSKYPNFVVGFNAILREEGVKGFYRGVYAQLLAVIPMTAMSFVFYETAKRVLVAVGEEEREEVKA